MLTEQIGERIGSPRRPRLTRDVVVNGRFLTQPVTGVQRYAREVVQALDDLLAEGALDALRVELVTPPTDREVPTFKRILVRQGGHLRGHAWEQLELPRLARGRLLLNLCNTGPATVRRQVVTIHDAAVFARPQAYSFAFRAWYRTLLRRLSRTALGIITPSAFSRDALAEFCHVDAARFQVVHHGREHVFRAAPDEAVTVRYGLSGRPFVLAVSSMSANKNFAAIAEAVASLDVDVVLVGGRNRRVFADTDALPRSFRVLGYVSDGELRALYEHATCLVYPSWYEGFGFPPLEAMACGCPVVASRAASLPEVCGDAALYCDPSDPAELAARIRDLVAEPATRAALRDAGLRRAAAFSWRASAMAHIRYLERFLDAA